MEGGSLTMSKKERSRLVVVSRVKEKQMTIKEASELLGISYRQCQRIYQRSIKGVDKRSIHRNRGGQRILHRPGDELSISIGHIKTDWRKSLD